MFVKVGHVNHHERKHTGTEMICFDFIFHCFEGEGWWDLDFHLLEVSASLGLACVENIKILNRGLGR